VHATGSRRRPLHPRLPWSGGPQSPPHPPQAAKISLTKQNKCAILSLAYWRRAAFNKRAVPMLHLIVSHPTPYANLQYPISNMVADRGSTTPTRILFREKNTIKTISRKTRPSPTPMGREPHSDPQTAPNVGFDLEKSHLSEHTAPPISRRHLSSSGVISIPGSISRYFSIVFPVFSVCSACPAVK
jgi:hypothetical protein